MPKPKRPRQEHIHLYAEIDNAGYCVYCGQPAGTLDHLTPLAFVNKLAAVMQIRTQLYTAPACMQCNGYAGDKIFDTFVEKFNFVKARLRVKLKTNYVNWSQEEFETLGPGLRKYVEDKLWADNVNARIARQRLEWKVESNPASVKLAELNLTPKGILVNARGDSVQSNVSRQRDTKQERNYSSPEKLSRENKEFVGYLVKEFRVQEGWKAFEEYKEIYRV